MKTYVKRGVYLAKKIVKEVYSSSLATESIGGWYIHDRSTGEALSPYCTGPNPAWRFAALLVSISKGYTIIDFLDNTMIDEITGEEYKEN